MRAQIQVGLICNRWMAGEFCTIEEIDKEAGKASIRMDLNVEEFTEVVNPIRIAMGLRPFDKPQKDDIFYCHERRFYIPQEWLIEVRSSKKKKKG